MEYTDIWHKQAASLRPARFFNRRDTGFRRKWGIINDRANGPDEVAENWDASGRQSTNSVELLRIAEESHIR